MKRSVLTATVLSTMLLPAIAQAAEGPVNAGRDSFAVAAMAVGFGLAILGGALGQGRAAAAAYDGICRNPGAAQQVFTPLLLGLALIESLVVLGFVGLNLMMFG